MFEDVEFFELFVVKAKLLDELRIAKNEEGTISDIGQVGTLVRALLEHVLDESVAVSVLLHTPFLDTVKAGKGGNVEFESGVHFFEFISNDVKFDDKFIDKPSYESEEDEKES